MNSQPNAAQKRWRERVRGLGSIISGGPAVIHHCAGRTARHNKIHLGHWWILPLTDDEHKLLHGDFGSFVQEVYFWNGETRKEVEKVLFADVVDEFARAGVVEDLPSEVYDAIMQYRR